MAIASGVGMPAQQRRWISATNINIDTSGVSLMGQGCCIATYWAWSERDGTGGGVRPRDGAGAGAGVEKSRSNKLNSWLDEAVVDPNIPAHHGVSTHLIAAGERREGRRLRIPAGAAAGGAVNMPNGSSVCFGGAGAARGAALNPKGSKLRSDKRAWLDRRTCMTRYTLSLHLL